MPRPTSRRKQEKMPRQPATIDTSTKYDEAVDRLKKLLDRLEPGEENWVLGPTEKSRSRSNRGKDYEKLLEKGKYSFLNQELEHRFKTSQPSWAKKAVVLHKLVAEEIEYHKSGSAHKPSKVLEKRTGDCQDQSLLLVNLYHDVGFDTWYYVVRDENRENPHAVPLVKIPDSSTPYRCMKKAYGDIFDESHGKMSWETLDGDYYFIADPEWSSYVGDLSSLKNKYADRSGNPWKWHNIREKHRFQSNQNISFESFGGRIEPVSVWDDSGGTSSVSPVSKTSIDTGIDNL